MSPETTSANPSATAERAGEFGEAPRVYDPRGMALSINLHSLNWVPEAQRTGSGTVRIRLGVSDQTSIDMHFVDAPAADQFLRQIQACISRIR